jgi:predicted dehydrogenase
MEKTFCTGFIGAGGIARPHAFSLASLKYFYNDSPNVELTAVSSATARSRESFASHFGFEKSLPLDEFFSDRKINTVYILGPNSVHYEHLSRAVKMEAVSRIYIEKPLCSSVNEETEIRKLAEAHPGIRFQVGFQYLFIPAVREALRLWNSGIFGKPFHFEIRYYHGDYLQLQYREKRTNRLTPAPDGGAMADLGSHAISLALAFLGNDIDVVGAARAGSFTDVDPRSDLFSTVLLRDTRSGAAGTLSASRVASGTGDMLEIEIYAEKGSLKFSSLTPGFFEYYLEDEGIWKRSETGSRYGNITTFPSGHVPGGWLRPMIHAHYVFLTGNDEDAFIPGIGHGLAVQKIIRKAAEKMKE